MTKSYMPNAEELLLEKIYAGLTLDQFKQVLTTFKPKTQLTACEIYLRVHPELYKELGGLI